MRAKTLMVLVAVVAMLAVAAAVMLRSGDESQPRNALGQQMFSDLPVQEIDRIRITSRSHQVTVGKDPSGWKVLERGGYPADFSKISDLVEKLKKLQTGRRFAVDAEIRDRLALHPPSETTVQEEKNARRIELLNAKNQPLADVLIGNPRESDRGFGGHYLMPTGQSTVVLADQSFRFLSAEPEEWLHLQVIDLKAESIESVSLHRGTKEEPVYTLKRPAKEEPLVLTDAAENASLDPAKAGRVTEALSPLQAEDVLSAADAGKDISFDGAERFVYTTFDGRRYTIELGGSFSRNEETFTYARLSKTPAPDAGKDKDAASGAKSGDEFAGWIYVLSGWKTEDFIKERAELLESKE